MATLSQLKTQRATAGANYAAAASAYVEAWIELAALDGTLSNSNIKGGHQHSFGPQPQIAVHGEFMLAPDAITSNSYLGDHVRDRIEQLVKEFTPG